MVVVELVDCVVLNERFGIDVGGHEEEKERRLNGCMGGCI